MGDVQIAPQEIARIQKVDVKPLNTPANSTYGYSKGNPIVEFQFAGQPALLRTSTLRLNGRLQVRTSANALPDNNNLKGSGAFSAGTGISINDRVGIHAIFQNILISNGLGSSLESVRNYPRMMASLLSTALSFDDYTVGQNLAQANDDATRNQFNQDINFSIPLLTGLLGSQQLIPLEQIGDGLRIQLELASDKQVLHASGGSSDTMADDALYSITDLSMTADVIIPTEQAQVKLQRQTSGSLVYQAYQSLYSTLTASDTTLSYTLNSSNVLSILHNFIETPFINNYRQDGHATDMLHATSTNSDGQLNKVTFIKNGVKYPNEYDLETESQSVQNNPEVQVMMAHLDSVVPLSSLRTTLNQPLLFPTFTGVQDKKVETSGRDVLPTVSRKRNFAIATAFDNVSNVGVNMKGQQYQARIQSNLTGNVTHGVYTYILARNVINYSPQGVLVQT